MTQTTDFIDPNMEKTSLLKYLSLIKYYLPDEIRKDPHKTHEILLEIEEHILDKAQDLSPDGRLDDLSLQKAIVEFGSPQKIALSYRRISDKPKIVLKIQNTPKKPSKKQIRKYQAEQKKAEKVKFRFDYYGMISIFLLIAYLMIIFGLIVLYTVGLFEHSEGIMAVVTLSFATSVAFISHAFCIQKAMWIQTCFILSEMGFEITILYFCTFHTMGTNIPSAIATFIPILFAILAFHTKVFRIVAERLNLYPPKSIGKSTNQQMPMGWKSRPNGFYRSKYHFLIPLGIKISYTLVILMGLILIPLGDLDNGVLMGHLAGTLFLITVQEFRKLFQYSRGFIIFTLCVTSVLGYVMVGDILYQLGNQMDYIEAGIMIFLFISIYIFRLVYHTYNKEDSLLF